ncbi:MAG TPA: hypothetical protein V6C95_19545 [Coleofasciculaceae cyanobacterium]
MPLLKTTRTPSSLRQLVALCLVQISLFFGLAITNFTCAAASASPLALEAKFSQIAPATEPPFNNKPLDLDQAVNKADEASQKVYQGLDKTKSLIGKTEKRNQAIEHGRNEASEKLQSLADKARRVKNSDESLSVTEKQALEQIQGKN